MSNLPILAVTMGDPSGIGPEIIVKALSLEHIYKICRPVVVADADVMRHAVKMVKADLMVHIAESVEDCLFSHGAIDVIDLDNVDISKLEFGKVSASSGAAAFESIIRSIDMAMEGKAAGVITAPINKDSMNQAGFHYSGHTEIFAERTGTKNYAMMLIHEPLRVVHVSTHVSLRRACDLVRLDRVYNVIKLSFDALKKLGIPEPKIAVAGLNPHAGENGMFGDEEIREITPAVEKAKSEGMNVDGPLPADTVFAKAAAGKYDVVVVMYHDQGHIPLKTSGFQYDRETDKWNEVSGINITLGLPILRSSVDHGTAFGKAGKGYANPQSMIEAIEYGARMLSKS